MSPLGIPGAALALAISVVTLVALFVADPVYRRVVIGAAVWFAAGLLWFALWARHRLVPRRKRSSRSRRGRLARIFVDARPPAGNIRGSSCSGGGHNDD